MPRDILQFNGGCTIPEMLHPPLLSPAQTNWHAKYDIITTPVSPIHLQAFLQNIPITSTLVVGFTHGFQMPHLLLTIPRVLHNHCSAYVQHEFSDVHIASKLSSKCISGSFTSPPHPAFLVSPLGFIPKKEPEAFQVIHDLLFPEGRSVNDLIAQASQLCVMKILTLSLIWSFGQVWML